MGRRLTKLNSVPTPLYHERLTRIRDTFPSPVSNRMHDAYFVFSILRARRL